MEIQDVGLPGWTLQLPNGMVLKMGSAQGVLIIPDEHAPDGGNAPDDVVKRAFLDVDQLVRDKEALEQRALNASGEYSPTDLRDDPAHGG